MSSSTDKTNNMESKNSPVTDEKKTETEVPPVACNDVKPNDEETRANEDYFDIDLSDLEISTGVLEELEKSMKNNESYANLMDACSSTAQALKETISDVLRTREAIVITAGDTTSELEASLSEKIADFENVVSGCFGGKDIKTDLTNIKHPAFSNVIITEVDESAEEQANAGAESPTAQITEEKSSPQEVTADVSEPKTDSKALPKENKTNASSKNSDNSSKKEKESSSENKTNVSSKNSDNSSKKEKESSSENKSAKVPAAEPETIPVSSTTGDEKVSKKQQKSNLSKKKGDKIIDQILKSLSNCSSTEEKLQTLCKKHAETLEELRLFEPRMKQLERQVMSQLKEKEQLQAEHNRMILAKSRLESLCRELQRQNKAVKEESLLRIKEEEERRKEIANKFQGTLNDISTLMQEHSKKNMQLREENAELAKKLKALVDHYDMWEKHMEKVIQQSHLEAQLAKAKYAKVNLLLRQETEKFLIEKQSLLENMSSLQKKCTLLTTNELKLRTELGDYTSKYDEFQTVLNKSSQVFSTFKTDMETTSKKIKKLEKETNVYKQKWENSNKALLGMINDKQRHDKELSLAQQRVATLEKLCRALQAERNELQNQINAVGSADSTQKDMPSVETQVA